MSFEELLDVYRNEDAVIFNGERWDYISGLSIRRGGILLGNERNMIRVEMERDEGDDIVSISTSRNEDIHRCAPGGNSHD